MGPALPTCEQGSIEEKPSHRLRLLHRPAVRHSVRSLLDELGHTEAEVSQSLRDAGVSGTRGDPRECAIARYLGAVVGAEPGISGVSVGRTVLWLSRRGMRPAVRVTLPVPVRRFVAAFDAGVHPELERCPVAASSFPHN